MGTYQNFSRKKQAEQSGYLDPSLPESNKVVRTTKLKNVDEWVNQIWYYRTHLDIFVEAFFSTEEKPIKLFPFQKVILRQYGNCQFIDDVESRGLGKTFKAALALFGLGVLYPGSDILIVSKTARQAILSIKYIKALAEKNTNVAREIRGNIKISKDYACVTLRNGTLIEAMAMSTDGSNIRGLRRKIIYVDESAWIKTEVTTDVLMPILELRRDVFWKLKDEGFKDYPSKFIQTSSAYLKSCDYFQRFKSNLIDMKNGDEQKFVCALPYTIGVRYGILSNDFVLGQKRKMPVNSFEMEWNAKFIGSADGAYFPYDLTEPCRTLETIELKQPRQSKTRYILSVDVATSTAETADNASICLIKLPENPNGTFKKLLVNMRTYHGFTLEKLANETRLFCIKFPNIEKLIIDVNAIGEGMLALLNNPYVDENNKEYPPLILDTSEAYIKGIKIIRGIRADNKYNNRIATATRMYLENKSLRMPVTSANLRRDAELDDSGKRLSQEELGIYIEADALQYEMGNIITRITASGNVVYETSASNQLKDRYISLAMALEYVLTLEEENKRNRSKGGSMFFGSAHIM